MLSQAFADAFRKSMEDTSICEILIDMGDRSEEIARELVATRQLVALITRRFVALGKMNDTEMVALKLFGGEAITGQPDFWAAVFERIQADGVK